MRSILRPMRFFARIEESEAWVPELWKLEVANVLPVGVRKKRCDAAFRDSVLANLSVLPIRLDAELGSQAWGATLKLAERHGLTLYDAAYLELARRRGLPLATLDEDLRRAATAEAVPLLGA